LKKRAYCLLYALNLNGTNFNLGCFFYTQQPKKFRTNNVFVFVLREQLQNITTFISIVFEEILVI